MFDTPLGIALFVMGIVLVVTAIIVYVIFFHKKLVNKIKSNKQTKRTKVAEKEARDNVAMSQVSDIFKAKDEAEGVERKDSSQVVDQLLKLNPQAAINQRNFEPPKAPEPKKKDDSFDTNNSGFNIMGQFKQSESKPEEKPQEEKKLAAKKKKK